MNKKVFLPIAFFLIIMAVFSSFQTQQDHKVLFEKAKYTMETKADLKEAINLFESLIQRYPGEKEYAANSQLLIGMCYEKLGRTEAKKAYKTVLDKYPDQHSIVAQAQEKLALLSATKQNIKPEGIITREVWSTAEDVSAVSPDGKYLTFIDWKAINIKVYDLKTEKSWPITPNGTWKDKYQYPDCSIFSTDSKQVAYYWYNAELTELRIVNLDGTGMRVLNKKHWLTPAPWPVEWSQDGKYILAINFVPDTTNVQKDKFQIVRVSVKDGAIDILTDLSDQFTESPSFSPDGQSFVFDVQQKAGVTEKDIYFRTVDGNKESIIVKHPANDWYPFFTEDGKNVIFLSDRSGSTDLWYKPVSKGTSAGEARLLKGSLEYIFNPIGRTNDGSLYYTTGTSTCNIYSTGIDLKTGKLTAPAPTKLSKRFEGGNRCPSLSPNGKYLAFCSQREKSKLRNMVFVIHDIETGEEYDIKTDLMAGVGFGGFIIRWSTDNKYLLFHARKNVHYQHGLYQLDITTGEYTVLLLAEDENNASFSTPQLAPDGKFVYVLSDLNKNLIKFDLNTNQKTEIYKSDKKLSYHVLSPDGKYLMFNYWFDNPNDIWIISTNGGEPKKIGSLLPDEAIEWPVWTPDSRNIVVIAHNSRKVYKYPIDGSQPMMLELSMKGKIHLEFHPDGDMIVFDEFKKGSNQVWAIDNFLSKVETAKNQK